MDGVKAATMVYVFHIDLPLFKMMNYYYIVRALCVPHYTAPLIFYFPDFCCVCNSLLCVMLKLNAQCVRLMGIY